MPFLSELLPGHVGGHDARYIRLPESGVMCASTSKSSPQGPNRGGATGGGPMALAHASPVPPPRAARDRAALGSSQLAPSECWLPRAVELRRALTTRQPAPRRALPSRATQSVSWTQP